jgi:hypothetical protein
MINILAMIEKYLDGFTMMLNHSKSLKGWHNTNLSNSSCLFDFFLQDGGIPYKMHLGSTLLCTNSDND